MLESIKKLRDQAKRSKNLFYQDVLDRLDELEREIAEQYTQWPLDADGVPWTENDEHLIYCVTGTKMELASICYDKFTSSWHIKAWDSEHRRYLEMLPHECRHVKPDSLKELLDDVSKGVICYPRERVTGYLEDNHSIGEAVMLDVRDRLRELLGGDA